MRNFINYIKNIKKIKLLYVVYVTIFLNSLRIWKYSHFFFYLFKYSIRGPPFLLTKNVERR